MRVLATTRLTDAFSVYGTMEEAAGETRQFRGPGRRTGLGEDTDVIDSIPEHLGNHHRNTLRRLFQHSVSHNVGWIAARWALPPVF